MWLLMLLCEQHVNEWKCLIHNEKISCFFNLLDMELFFEPEEMQSVEFKRKP